MIREPRASNPSGLAGLGRARAAAPQAAAFPLYSVSAYDFEWDEQNTAHIARHGVNSEQAVEVFRGRVYRWKFRGGVYCALGRPAGGRRFFVAYVLKGRRCIRVVTARDMTGKESALYRRNIR